MTDRDLGWHLTATWADVREKARRIRAEGGVRLIVARPDRVVAHVRGDTETYETELTRVPGRRQVAMWSCACAWASYSWGRSAPFKRFEGRKCSHALATQYEAQSRGMFGRDVQVDRTTPAWADPARVRQPGSYDRDTGRHSALAAEPAGQEFHVEPPPPAEFVGRVDGQVLPLAVDPQHGVVGPRGPVDPAAVTHPGYHPTEGLVLGAVGRPQAVRAAVDEAPEAPTHAGLVLKARDTGRILMLQRSIKDEEDPAAGTWEMPGGKIEDGDHNSLHAAFREFEEEVGQPVPAGGTVAHTWTSPNGVYQGHVVVVPSEAAVALHEGRVRPNPDDPGGDDPEQAAWWEVDHARKNPALREEVKAAPWKEIKVAARWSGEVGLEEFGDLPAAENGVDDDPEHALPVAYGEDERTALLVRAELARRGTRTAARDFTLAEQRELIEEGADVRAGNLSALSLEGTHYSLMGAAGGDDEMWGW